MNYNDEAAKVGVKVLNDYQKRLGPEADKFEVDEKASVDNNLYWRIDGASDAITEIKSQFAQAIRRVEAK